MARLALGHAGGGLAGTAMLADFPYRNATILCFPFMKRDMLFLCSCFARVTDPCLRLKSGDSECPPSWV